jgi:hypothetical protein
VPPLPKPLSERSTGMPQMRRRSAVRTAAGSVQEAFLERVRAVRDDPLLAFPDVVGGEPRELARLREALESARDGKLGFFARRDKGLLGAVWACRELAGREGAPRLLDARIDGNRRFFLPVGHIDKTACLGVQNWDDPLALLQAYAPFAEGGLFFFAGPDVWCTGKRPALVAEWVEALGARLEVALELDGASARCAHPDRASLAHVLGEGGDGARVEVRLCAACCGPETGAVLASRLATPGGRRPFTLAVVLPDGTRKDVGRDADAYYRVGKATGADLVQDAVSGWHAALGAGRYAIGDRLFAGQDAFLDAVEAPAWMRPALAAMTAGGHAAPPMSLADLLARHRDRLADGVRALGGDPASLAAKGANADEGALLRLAHESAERAAKTSDLPDPRAKGRIGSWIDGFVRLRRVEGEATAVARTRREAAILPHKAHVAAFLVACGADASVGTGFTRDQVEAGQALAPLARRVLESTGPAYLEALRGYLMESGSGETSA